VDYAAISDLQIKKFLNTAEFNVPLYIHYSPETGLLSPASAQP
jgi:hypothetical protein